jgi:hypothetical protein
MELVRRLAVSAVLTAVLLTTGGTACGAAGDGTPLFRDTPRPPTAPPADPQPVLRSRYVEVDFDALAGANPTPANAPATLLLNLFPDATFTAERDSTEPTSSGHGVIWTGHLQGAPDSAVTLVAEDGVLAGTIRGGGHSYNVAYAGDGVHVLREINPGGFPPD